MGVGEACSPARVGAPREDAPPPPASRASVLSSRPLVPFTFVYLC